MCEYVSKSLKQAKENKMGQKKMFPEMFIKCVQMCAEKEEERQRRRCKHRFTQITHIAIFAIINIFVNNMCLICKNI